VIALYVLAVAALSFAALPALLYALNTRLFRPPPDAPADTGLSLPRVSVLIPARNEERSIGACVESALASRGVELEVIVLDDHSDDRTADIVREMARKDPRVRLEPAPPLPDGWCGKQHACYTLSKLARFPVLTFLDADVRLAPDALARMAAFLDASGAELVSGFPGQETGTFPEKLVIPLINWLLLCYLPIGAMRRFRLPGFGVGCGQWFMTRREAYEAAGGHAAVKASLHDGITLPRAYRRAGFRTDICDATGLAVCRMYRSGRELWFGLAKNAREGLGAPGLIWVWTVLLFAGHVLPFLLLGVTVGMMARPDWFEADPLGQAAARATGQVLFWLALHASLLSLAVRFEAAWAFRQSWLGAALHPLGALVLLAIQWYAACRSWIGKPVGWKGRSHPGEPGA
jgi:glycosyltransferase involved in cell wall biosynthesis